MNSKNLEIDTTTCWYDLDECPQYMILGAQGKLWPVLEKSSHFPMLKALLEQIPEECITLIDVGCGAAELSRLVNGLFYVGADLENIIENVARKMHPHSNYVSFDIYGGPEECKFIEDYDVVVMNAFIDVLQYPITGLRNILTNAQNYVILHRQEFDSTGVTRIERNPSYGSGMTYQSIINQKEFDGVLQELDFKVIKEVCVFKTAKSILLLKEK